MAFSVLLLLKQPEAFPHSLFSFHICLAVHRQSRRLRAYHHKNKSMICRVRMGSLQAVSAMPLCLDFPCMGQRWNPTLQPIYCLLCYITPGSGRCYCQALITPPLTLTLPCWEHPVEVQSISYSLQSRWETKGTILICRQINTREVRCGYN